MSPPKNIQAACLLALLIFASPSPAQPPQPIRLAQSGGTASSPATAGEAIKTLDLPAGGAAADFQRGSIFFVGTATVLIRYAGFTILTDPNFLHRGDHVHLGYGLTSERLTEPAIPIEKLPPIDLVVLSHMHGDHFDQLVQERLDKSFPIVTTPQAAEALREMGFKSRYPLETWQSLAVTKGDARLTISSMPGRHGPPVVAALLPRTMGSMLEFQESKGGRRFRIYISGDTLVFDEIAEIPRRYADIDLALLHLGGTKLLGLVMVTMDAQQGVQMLRVIAPRTAIPIHYNDYTVFRSPLEDFQKAVRAAGLEEKLRYLKHGDTHQFDVPAR